MLRNIVFLVAACLAISTEIFAQKITVGVITGASVTDDFRATTTIPFAGAVVPSGDMDLSTTSLSNASSRFIIGPMMEVRLSKGLSLRAEALHREVRSTTQISLSPPLVTPDG